MAIAGFRTISISRMHLLISADLHLELPSPIAVIPSTK